jgi:hypothetical protein
MQHVSSPPLPDLSNLSLEQLRDLIEMQQRTIGFLIGQYNDLLDQVDDENSRVFGPPTQFQPGAKIPIGWWQSMGPPNVDTHQFNMGGNMATNQAGHAFWSDGDCVTAIGTGAVTMHRIRQRPPSTTTSP